MMCEICPEVKQGSGLQHSHRPGTASQRPGGRRAASGARSIGTFQPQRGATGIFCFFQTHPSPGTAPAAGARVRPPGTGWTMASPGDRAGWARTRPAPQHRAASLPPGPRTPLRWGCQTHHPHFGEVHQAVLGVIRGPLLDERQVGQVHSEVGDARRVTTSGASQKQVRKQAGGWRALPKVGLPPRPTPAPQIALRCCWDTARGRLPCTVTQRSPRGCSSSRAAQHPAPHAPTAPGSSAAGPSEHPRGCGDPERRRGARCRLRSGAGSRLGNALARSRPGALPTRLFGVRTMSLHGEGEKKSFPASGNDLPFATPVIHASPRGCSEQQLAPGVALQATALCLLDKTTRVQAPKWAGERSPSPRRGGRGGIQVPATAGAPAGRQQPPRSGSPGRRTVAHSLFQCLPQVLEPALRRHQLLQLIDQSLRLQETQSAAWRRPGKEPPSPRVGGRSLQSRRVAPIPPGHVTPSGCSAPLQAQILPWPLHPAPRGIQRS